MESRAGLLIALPVLIPVAVVAAFAHAVIGAWESLTGDVEWFRREWQR